MKNFFVSRTSLIFFLAIGGILTFTLPVFAEKTKEAEPSAPAASGGASLTLADCYQLAIAQSEKVAIQKESITQTEARLLQAFGNIMPEISFSYSEERQNGTDSNDPEAKFVVTQPLFSGFKEFASIGAGRAQLRQFQNAVRRAKELLFIDVSDAFYLYLSYQEDLTALDTIKQALIEQLGELEKREKLGRSRPSEVASAEVRLRRLEADAELAASQKEVAGELLRFLIGRPVKELKDEDIDFTTVSARENYLAKSDMRADVLAVKEAFAASQKQITVARADYFPTVELGGNYYTKPAGDSSDVDWDATLTVDAPIFNGTETYGKVKEARSLSKQEELNLKSASRNATLEIDNAYTKFQASLRRRDVLERAYQAAVKNYELQTADFHLNLVNNLEVLQALEDLEDTRRQYTQALYDAKRLFWALKAATGDIPDGHF